MTYNTGPILVFPRIQPFGSVYFVYSRHATVSVKMCLFFSVFCHEVLSDSNCCQECWMICEMTLFSASANLSHNVHPRMMTLKITVCSCVHIQTLVRQGVCVRCGAGFSTRNPASEQILITLFFVRAFALVLGTFAADLLAQDHRSKVQMFSSTNLLAQTMGHTVLPKQVSPFLHSRLRIPHASLRLLRRY